ncbi:MAG: sodium/substrate symporter small subunit [Hyphomicrobiales bacterium]
MNPFDRQSPFIQQQHAHWLRGNRLMLVMLGLWLLFSLTVYLFVIPLNKITVPVLNMPLGIFIAAQGALVVFVVMLFHFARQHDGGGGAPDEDG